MSQLDLLTKSLPFLLYGTGLTLILTVVAFALSFGIGTFVAIARMSQTNWVSLSALAFINFFRGTPLLVQLFIVYFGLPSLLQSLGIPVRFDRFSAAVIALSLDGAADMAEVLRAGILGVGRGQWEVARALGFRAFQVWLLIIFPQAFRQSIPPLGNEFIGMLKNTSLVAIIGYEELFRKGQLIVAEMYRPFEIYGMIALIYLILTFALSAVTTRLERTFSTPV